MTPRRAVELIAIVEDEFNGERVLAATASVKGDNRTTRMVVPLRDYVQTLNVIAKWLKDLGK